MSHDPADIPAAGHSRPNPSGWQGGSEDFEVIWTLKGHKLPPTDLESAYEIGRISRNHQRLRPDTPGFCD